MKKQFLPKTALIICFLLISSCLLRAQDDNLEKPEPIDNKEIDQLVDDSFLIYDSTCAIKNVHIPALDAEVKNLKENYADIDDPEAEKKTLQAKAEMINTGITGLIPRAEDLTAEGPDMISKSVSNVKPGFKAPKEIKAIKNNGNTSLKALKESLKMLPDMANQSKDMMKNITDLQFTE